MANSKHEIHHDHPHKHGPGCGHTAVRHGDHVDYLHDGHLHHAHGDHYDEHAVEVTAGNPERCTPDHACGGHDSSLQRVQAMRREFQPLGWIGRVVHA